MYSQNKEYCARKGQQGAVKKTMQRTSKLQDSKYSEHENGLLKARKEKHGTEKAGGWARMLGMGSLKSEGSSKRSKRKREDEGKDGRWEVAKSQLE